jgi:hypothetical protein
VSAKILPWVLMAVLDIAAPIVVYDVASGAGFGDVPALLFSAIGPLLNAIISVVVRGRIDEFSAFVLTLIVVGAATSLLFSDARLLLLKESAVTGILGLLFLASVPTSRPAIFLFGRRFATGGDPERVAWWNGLWQFPLFRRTQRLMTTMWGVGLFGEAVVRIVLTFQLSVATMVVVNAVVPPIVLGVLILATIIWGKRAGKAGEARSAAAAAEAAPA